ncbi:MAG: 6-phosphogluconolactonase [Pseudomonadota bacterium]
MKLESYSTDTIDTLLAERVARHLTDAVNTKGWASLAVPGGTTPAPFLTALRHYDIDWSNVRVTLTDERCVPADNPRSNGRLVSETLLQGPARAAEFVGLYDGSDTTIHVSDALRSRVLPLDVCVLGMGEDMHTASLFPGTDGLADALDPTANTVMARMTVPGVPEARLTLTAAALTRAANVYLLIKGAAKRAALDRALAESDAQNAPVRAILDAAQEATVFYAD